MAIITEVEAEAGFQIMIRWFAKASQRYPVNENEYYFTSFPMLTPGDQFVLADPRFDINNINDIEADLEYTIRDFCYVQTLLPQFVGFTYIQPDYRQATLLTMGADVGATTITVAANSFMQEDNILTPTLITLAAGDTIVIGPRPEDTRMIVSVAGMVITLDEPLSRSFPSATAVNLFPVVSLPVPGVGVVPYPDVTAPAGLARVLNNDGDLLTDTLEVNTPIFFDTGETIRRYYYSASLDVPFNGSRGPGDTIDTMVLHNGETISGGWWVFGEADNTAGTESILIDAQGFELDTRERDNAFTFTLSRSDTESQACGGASSATYYGNHSNFTNVGMTSLVNTDQTDAATGYYAWTNNIMGSGDIGNRFVRYWNGRNFESGRVGAGSFAPCPIALTATIQGTTYTLPQDFACLDNGTTRNLWYDATGDGTFTATNVTAIYTDQFGPNSDPSSLLPSLYLRAGGTGYFWDGTTLTVQAIACLNMRYCGNVLATNASAGPGIRDDSLCNFPRIICGNAAATNYTPPGSRLSTDSIDNSTCTFPAARSARYTVSGEIGGPRAGIVGSVSADSGEDGDTWNISASYTLAANHEWVTTPTSSGNSVYDAGSNTLTFSDSGTFAGADVNIPITLTGRGETRVQITAVPGCNTVGAFNYDATSDGTQDCFFDAGTFAFASIGSTACDDANGASQTSRTLARSDADSNIREWDTTANTRLGGAQGFYSDGTTVSQYSNGSLVGTTTCPLPFRLSSVSITRFTDQVSRNQEFVVQGTWSFTGTQPASVTYQWSGTSLLGDTADYQAGNGRTNPDLVLFRSTGTFNLTLTVFDGGSVIGSRSQRITVLDPERNLGGA